ncbi:MAG: alpha-ketoglutarate decarboxylase [Oceanihabitans sp.]
MLLVCIFLTSFSTIAQNLPEERQSNFWKNVRFGGGIGLSFGDGFFSGSISPSGIYQFNSKFSLGLGLNATYNKRKNFYKSTIFGGSILGFYNPIRELQLSVEFEELHVNRDFDTNYVANIDTTYWSPALFVGAGYRVQNLTIGVRYDLLYDTNKSVYAQAWMPFVRVYF